MMDRMPPEILRLILLALSEIEDSFDEPTVSITDIKALRLSCRIFADLAPEYLFHNIWLYMEEDSFAKLKALTDHPNYGRMVRGLKFFPKLLSADLLVKEDYETCVKDITFTGDRRENWGFDRDGKRDLSQEQLDAGFLEYNQIHEQQVQTRISADSLLHNALAAFTTLGSITTGFVDEIIDDAACFDQCSKVQDIARKTLMAARCDGWKSDTHDPEDAIMILTAIASSEREGLGLHLTNTFDISFVDIHPCAFEEVKKALFSLNYLTLSLGAICAVLLREVIDNGLLANFLKYAANVQYLNVRHQPVKTMLFFERIFSMAHWSSLASVVVQGIIVNADDLNGFVDRHSASLEYLSLDMMLLKSGSWKSVFTSMQGRKALNIVTVGNLIVGDVDSEHLWAPILIPWDAASEDLLSAFILRGEKWSPDLPAGYSQEAKWVEEWWI